MFLSLNFFSLNKKAPERGLKISELLTGFEPMTSSLQVRRSAS
jgi:hypothetical protein